MEITMGSIFLMVGITGSLLSSILLLVSSKVFNKRRKKILEEIERE